jgi:hypothetical protein
MEGTTSRVGGAEHDDQRRDADDLIEAVHESNPDPPDDDDQSDRCG